MKEHKTFIRDGETIHVRQPISFSLAALGGEILVPTVDGAKPLKISTGTQTGTTSTMKELGVPRLNNPTKRGDQIVHLIVETPSKLSGEEKKLLEKLAELRGEKLKLSKDDIAEIESDKEEEDSSESRNKSGSKSSKSKKERR